MSVEQNKSILRRYFDLQNAHDLEGAFALLSPNIIPHNVPGVAGLNEVIGYFTAMHKAVPNLQTTVHDWIAEGDRVVVRFTVSGNQTGEFMGEPGNGQPVEWNIITIYRFEDGLITEVWS